MALMLAITLLLGVNPRLARAAPSTVIYNGIPDKPMALTFDAGSDVGNTAEILGTLAKYNIKSTFFLTGQYTELHPELARQIITQGHEIGNHSYSHPDFTKITPAQMKTEIVSARQEIQKASGKAPAPLFRPPYGSYNAAVLQAVGDAGYKWTVMWSIDTVDWKGIPANDIIQKVLNNAQPGAIVLMHVGYESNTHIALPAVIEGLKAKGYRLTTVSDILGNNVSAPSTGHVYTVLTGDTLYKIASMFNTTVQTLVELNNIANPDLITPGQTLILPVEEKAPKTYTVKAGDTLWQISGMFNTTVEQIARLNNIANPALINPGQVLTIP